MADRVLATQSRPGPSVPSPRIWAARCTRRFGTAVDCQRGGDAPRGARPPRLRPARRPPPWPGRTAPRTAARRRRRRPAARCACPARRSGPLSMTRIRSASRIVDSRCAITKLVRPWRSEFIARWISTSVRVSTELVASSRIRIAGPGQERAGDRDQLPLPHADVAALVVEDGLVAVRQGAHEPVDVRRLGRLDDGLPGRVRRRRRRCCRRSCRRTARRPAAPCRSCARSSSRLIEAMSTPSSVIRPPSSS